MNPLGIGGHGTTHGEPHDELDRFGTRLPHRIKMGHGMSGKELQRQLGVTYKTAWRMGQQIRLLMSKADGFEMLRGHVEMDEACVGGKRPGKRGRGAAGKTIVYGMKEREGRMNTEIVSNIR